MFVCKFCGKEYDKSGPYKNHELRCPKNLDRVYKNGMTGKKGSNQYIYAELHHLPKPTASQSQKGKPGKKHTPESKKKLSDSMKKFLRENPEKVPYKLNHSSKISYPEQYFRDCFKNIEVSIEYRVSTYSLDFCNVNTKHYLEIDGEQHYVDPKIVAHDIKRTEFLDQLGWKCKRIRWSEYCKLDSETKEKLILDCKEWLSL